MGDRMINDETLLNSVLKTAQMGRFGIETVLDKAINPGLKQELRSQKAQYDDIENEANTMAAKQDIKLKGLGAPARYMASMMGRLSIMGEHRDSKIAGMLIQGNTRGMILGMKNLRRGKRAESDVRELTQKLIDQEKAGIKASQQFL
jgi:hypothetical protein